jgi:2-oxo-3-hexenedioate decarboxylase
MDPKLVAEELDAALLERREVAPLTKRYGDFTLPQAYEIQKLGLERQLSRGEKVVGYKMGLTSAAKRQQMNLGEPIYGYLLESMRVRGPLPVSSGIHPKVEPEIAFITSKELSGKLSRADALHACSSIFPALEILDSRFTGFKYFSLPDVVADNCSSWRFVTGEPRAPRDPGNRRMRMTINGEVKQEADSNAISGNPLESLVQLVQLLPHPLPAGSLVLAGAATAAEMLAPGMKVRLEVEGLGDVWLETA